MRAFSIFVPTCENDPTKDELPARGTAWVDCPGWVKNVERVSEKLQGYILRMHQQSGEGRLFFFAKKMTEAERHTPYLIEPERRPQYWPTVLKKLWAETIFDSSGNQSILDHSIYRDGNTYPTVLLTKHYFSDELWPKSKFSKSYPLTDSINIKQLGLQISFPECLHPLVTAPAPTGMNSRGIVFGLGTPEKSVGSDFIEERFEATPMEDWGRYDLEIVKEQVMGMYHYIVTEALPPIDDREETT